MTTAVLQEELLRFVYAAMLHGTTLVLHAVATVLGMALGLITIVWCTRAAARRRGEDARRGVTSPGVAQRSSRSSFSAAANSLRNAS